MYYEEGHPLPPLPPLPPPLGATGPAGVIQLSPLVIPSQVKPCVIAR